MQEDDGPGKLLPSPVFSCLLRTILLVIDVTDQPSIRAVYFHFIMGRCSQPITPNPRFPLVRRPRYECSIPLPATTTYILADIYIPTSIRLGIPLSFSSTCPQSGPGSHIHPRHLAPQPRQLSILIGSGLDPSRCSSFSTGKLFRRLIYLHLSHRSNKSLNLNQVYSSGSGKEMSTLDSTSPIASTSQPTFRPQHDPSRHCSDPLTQ